MGVDTRGAATGIVKGTFLGLDTSGRETGLALIKDARVIFTARTAAGVSHNENLLPLIDTAFAQAGIKPDHLTGICLTIGPGMFTSLRVGLSIAKGLALGLGLLIKGVDTLLALSFTVGMEMVEPLVLASIDARKGEVYAGLYHGRKTVIPPRVISPEGLAGLLGQIDLSGETLIIAGDGADTVEPMLKRAGYHIGKTRIICPSPVAVGYLGINLLTEEGGDDPSNLEPVYLRRTDAELKRERR